ncbi:MAG: right-handed parallel beta-helix repeat-containing protein [Myxococcota bacterium]
MRRFLWLAGLGAGCNLDVPKDEGLLGGQDPDDGSQGDGDGDDDTHPDEDDTSGGGPDVVTHTVCTEDAEFATIQAGIDAASDGEAVAVCPGTWRENLEVRGKSLVLYAAEGEGTVVVDGGELGAGLTVADTAAGVTVRGLTFTNGRAVRGGGVACTSSRLIVEDVTLARNLADDGGGGVWASACNVTIRGARVEANEAWGDGGGGLFEGAEGSITDSAFVGNSGDNGGGLAAIASALVVEGTEVSGNAAFNGGGLWFDGGTSVVASTVNDNVTSYNGGGIYVLNGTGSIVDSEISRNSSLEGGGLYFYESASYFARNLVEDNEAPLDDAGGARVYASSLVIEDNVFRGNYAGDSGGAAKISHGRSVVSGNTFERNVADWAGGGLEVDDDTSELTRNRFVGNEARMGGGLRFHEPWYDVVAAGNWFEANSAREGGAVALAENLDDDELDGPFEVYYSVTLRHTVAVQNTAQEGGAFFADYSHLHVENSILAGNEADDVGGAIAWINSGGHVDQAVIHGNSAGSGVLGVFWGFEVTMSSSVVSQNDGSVVWTEASPWPTLRWTDVWGNSGGDDAGRSGEGNLAGDPAFEDPAGWDFHLSPGSPCIDGGNPDRHDTDGTRADMGAFGGPQGSW